MASVHVSKAEKNAKLASGEGMGDIHVLRRHCWPEESNLHAGYLKRTYLTLRTLIRHMKWSSDTLLANLA